MLKLNVLNLLKERGKTKYWLYNQLSLSYQNFNNMVNNKTKSIKYEMIETLCDIFNCSVEDLFIVSENKKQPKI